MLELKTKQWRDITFRSFDDLSLYARHYPAPDERFRSVICLAGLTRNSRDFHALATYLSTHPETPRNVYSLDYRGRGKSQFDRNWRNYMPKVEMADLLDFLTVQGLHQVGIIGTSRGGIVTM
ncbi:MAG: alpha/beta hydrolase, partial [Pseudomonadota bacterium]